MISGFSIITLCPDQESLDSPIDRRSSYYREQARHLTRATLKRQPLLTPPNVLTLARIVMVPVFMGTWYWRHRFGSILTALVFILAAVTDWADGYLARRVGDTVEYSS
jgi:CDP-diacylglycerol---glycerol-3-phosphate 3-phosphatidyltransferase